MSHFLCSSLSLARSLSSLYWSLCFLYFMSQYNYIFYDIHRIRNMRAYTQRHFIVVCRNQHGTTMRPRMLYNKYARHNTNSCMVNKIFLSHSMSFVKLTVDFYDGACCAVFASSALIQFHSILIRYDSTNRFFYIIWRNPNRNFYLSRIWHAFRHAQCWMPVHVFAIYVSIAPHLCNFQQLYRTHDWIYEIICECVLWRARDPVWFWH